MGVTYNSRCPHCKTLLYSSSVEEPMSFGNPNVVCPKCSKTFFDSKKMEWVNLTKEEKKSVLVLGTDKYITEEKEYKKIYKMLMFTSFLLITIPFLIRTRKIVKAFENFVFDKNMLDEKNIQESIQRTRNIEYMKELIIHGRYYYGEEYEQ